MYSEEGATSEPNSEPGPAIGPSIANDADSHSDSDKKAAQHPRSEKLSAEDSESPAVRDLPRLRPSHVERTSSHNSGKGKRQQPVKRPQQHSRSQSNSRITSTLSTSSGRPHGLSRSKSTDVITRMGGHQQMKRSNKSFTKLSSLHPTKSASNVSMNRAVGALQPLTKTTLNSSMTRGSGMHPLTKTVLRDSAKHYALRKTILNGSQKGGFVPLSRNKSELSIKSNKSNSSLKGALHGGLKSSAKRGRAILKLNEEYPDENYEDVSNDSEADDEDTSATENKLEKAEPRQYSSDNITDDADNDDRASALYGGRQSPKPGVLPSGYKTTDSSSEDLSRNMYGGSFLLSQSTGMTKKIGSKAPGLDYSFVEDNGSRALGAGVGANGGVGGLSGGLVFKAGENKDSADSPEPIVTKTNVAKGGLYHSNQSIFSNLQRNDLQFSSNMKQLRPSTNERKLNSLSSNKNFSGFLESNNAPATPGLETRTQQRLWLQRENSLMDVSSNLDPANLTNFSNLSLNKLMFAHNMNSSANIRDMQISRQGSYASYDMGGGLKNENPVAFQNDQAGTLTSFMNIIQNVHQNSIQSRTEFERLNREYVNVRRHSNPVAASLARIEQFIQNGVSGSVGVSARQKDTLPFLKKDGATGEELEQYKAQQLNRLWQEALHTSSASSVALKRCQDDQLQQQYQQDLQRQNQERGREDSARERLSKLNVNGTRAVKSGVASKTR